MELILQLFLPLFGYVVISFFIVFLFSLAMKRWVLFIPSFSLLLLSGYLFLLEKTQKAKEGELPLDTHLLSVPSFGTAFINMLIAPLILFTLIWTVLFLVKFNYKDKKVQDR